MSRSYTIVYDPAAARQVQRERAWLYKHRGRERADDFEAELDHTLDLLEENPEMGAASRWGRGERAVFLRRSRFHVFYQVLPETEEILVVRLRHEKQRPL